MNMEKMYDVGIIGGGPIGASTAYFLSQMNIGKSIVLVTKDPSLEPYTSAYMNAGGSIRWYFGETVKEEMTKITADFIKEKASQGVDLSLIEDMYVFIPEGIATPSLNINGKKLVEYFINEAQKKGVHVVFNSEVNSLAKSRDGYVFSAGGKNIEAKKVLVATGAKIPELVPDAPFAFEKRQLYVLDVPVDENRARMPHVIFPVKGGEVYFFVKKFGDAYKIVVGEEDLIVYGKTKEPEDKFNIILEAGAGDIAKFFKDAKVERILCGFDAKNKIPEFYTEDNKLYAVACGSAVRSCVYIGKKGAELISV